MKPANAPRQLCRRYLVLKLLRQIKGRKFLEIGIGRGDLILKLISRGYYGKGIDLSKDAVDSTKKLLRYKHKDKKVDVIIEKGDFFKLKKEKYDLVLLFEVLEHIKEDSKALKKIGSLLNKNGLFMLSVPAHKHLWCSNDELSGHIRRYERRELIKKIQKAGFNITVFWSYGFPLVNIIKPFRDWIVSKRIKNEQPLSMEEKTLQSGVDKPLEEKLGFVFNDFFLYPFYLLQELFLNYDLGTGYLVLAEKK